MNTYFTKEEKGKDVLLFLHGWGCDGSVFAPLASQLNSTNYLVDLWGFGKSDTPLAPWSVVDYAHQLKSFCDKQGLARFSIVCHSFGARVAVVFASMYPNMVQKLLIVGGAGLKRASIKRFCAVAKYKLLKRLAKWGVYKGKLPQGSADYQSASGVMKQTFVKVVNQDLSRYAKKITCPTLLVWGRCDRATPLWMGRKYNRLVRDSALIVLDGDHFVFLQRATQVAMIANAFLEGN